MTTRTRIILGLAALWPFLYLGYVVTSRLYIAWLGNLGEVSEIDYWWRRVDSYLLWFTSWWCLGLFVVYAVFLFRNAGIDARKRSRWLAGFLLAGPLAFPFYWYAHIMRAPRGNSNEAAEE